VKISTAQLHNIIREEIKESLASSRLRLQSAQQLEKVMVHLLHQKQSNEPGTEEHDKAKEQLAQMAAVAQEYAYIGKR
jgi:PhoPQ-activated pathogenicity-related protein